MFNSEFYYFIQFPVNLQIRCQFVIDHLCWFCAGPTPGRTHPNHSRAGVLAAAMEARAGATLEITTELGPTAIGGSPKKARGPLAGTVTATAPVPDVGASQAETPAAATPGEEAEGQILLTRALRIQVPTGATRSTSPISLKATAGANR